MGKKYRKYKPLDTERLMRELKQQDKPSVESANLIKKEPIIPVISEEEKARRRRQSLLDDRRNLYVYDRLTGVYHDRDCICVNMIKPKYFDMISNNAPNSDKFCEKCLFKASVRWASRRKSKLVDICYNFLSGIGIETRKAYILCVKNDTSFLKVEGQKLYLKVNDDKWIVERDLKNNVVILWHNDYIVESDYYRTILDQYHLQATMILRKSNNLITILYSYSWENHIKQMQAQKAREEKELLLKNLRERFKHKSNYYIEKNGLIFIKLSYVDIGNESRVFFKKNKVKYLKLKSMDDKSCFPIRRCLVFRFSYKAFKKTMKSLIKMGISEEYRDYVISCFDK